MAYTLRGIEYLRKKLGMKRGRVLKRYRAYEMKNSMEDFMNSETMLSISTRYTRKIIRTLYLTAQFCQR